MGWFSRRQAVPEPPPAPLDIPLFPLNTVLFPGGQLGLKIFEQRYLDMAAACLRDQRPFGVCLIAEGGEVGAPAVPHPVGTLATIASADMPQLGILMVSLRGGAKYRIRERRIEADGLQRASVNLLAETSGQVIPDNRASLVTLLQTMAEDLGPARMPPPYAYDDAGWVSHRLAEVMPVQALAKQKLLELDDPLQRLEILFSYLAQRGLVK
jgi:Lon protease-like protein